MATKGRPYRDLITGSIAGSANLGGTGLTVSGDDVLVAKVAP